MQAAQKLKTSQEILAQALDRKKSKNHGYSLRALARDIGKSPGFVSQVLSGKRRLTPEVFELLANALEVDDMARIHLSLSVVHDSKLPDEVKSNALSAVRSERGQTEYARYEDSTLPDFDVVHHWYNVAILDLVSLENFEPRIEWIAKKLNLSAYQVQTSVEMLFGRGLLVIEDGKWKKSKYKLRFSTVQSKASMRQYHKQMIEKAQAELMTKTDQESFDNRLITCMTVATNRENIERAKRRINEMMFEISDILSQGECTEVFQFNAQMFGLTVRDEDKK